MRDLAGIQEDNRRREEREKAGDFDTNAKDKEITVTYPGHRERAEDTEDEWRQGADSVSTHNRLVQSLQHAGFKVTVEHDMILAEPPDEPRSVFPAEVDE